MKYQISIPTKLSSHRLFLFIGGTKKFILKYGGTDQKEIGQVTLFFYFFYLYQKKIIALWYLKILLGIYPTYNHLII